MSVPGHDLRRIQYVSPVRVTWFCSCGKNGVASQAFEGEDLETKARRNHTAHAHREARKA